METTWPQRRSIRLREYDYRSAGAYFITVCSFDRQCVFGAVQHDAMCVNDIGRIVRHEWFRAMDVRDNVELHPDEFVVMLNHVHGIIWLVYDVGEERATRRVAPTGVG